LQDVLDETGEILPHSLPQARARPIILRSDKMISYIQGRPVKLLEKFVFTLAPGG